MTDLDHHADITSIITSNTVEHARVRRLFSPGFSDRALKQQEPLFRKYTDLLASKLLHLAGQPVDVTVMTNLTTFDIMAELTFGEPLGLLENSKYTDWVQNLIQTIHLVPRLQVIQYHAWLKWAFERFAPAWVREAEMAHANYSADRVDRRLERGSGMHPQVCSTTRPIH